MYDVEVSAGNGVSTHSRPKAAGGGLFYKKSVLYGFNTQPPEGGWGKTTTCSPSFSVSTHSRPKAAGVKRQHAHHHFLFQHTAARRRLGMADNDNWHSDWGFNTQPPEGGWAQPPSDASGIPCFNTQPPEGGWDWHIPCRSRRDGFNTQPPEGGWRIRWFLSCNFCCFNTQPPEGGWPAMRHQHKH